MDTHKRAAYDNIFGFDEDAVNPFKDAAESRDQVRQVFALCLSGPGHALG